MREVYNGSDGCCQKWKVANGSHSHQRLFGAERHRGRLREWWQDVKGNITAQPGFISGKFHRSLKPESRYNFINVAVWENEEVYWKAYEKSVTPMKMKLEQMGIEMVPALYNVAFEY